MYVHCSISFQYCTSLTVDLTSNVRRLTFGVRSLSVNVNKLCQGREGVSVATAGVFPLDLGFSFITYQNFFLTNFTINRKPVMLLLLTNQQRAVSSDAIEVVDSVADN